MRRVSRIWSHRLRGIVELSDVVSSSFCFILFFLSIDVHDLLLGQPLRREASYLEEVDLPRGDPRAGLTFSELLTLERQRVQHITPDPSWKGSPWSSPDSAPGPSRTPSPSTGDGNSPSSTPPRRRGKSSSFLLSFLFLTSMFLTRKTPPTRRRVHR